MACLYNISGSEFSELEVKQILKSAAAIPGNEGLTEDELLDLVKQAVSDRFVNMNLFNLVQEQSIVNSIFSAFVEDLGILTPGQKYEKSARTIFTTIKSKLTNTSTRIKYVLDNIAISEEEYNDLRDNADEALLAKIPELKNLTYSEFSYLSELLGNVIDDVNYQRFTDQAVQKLNKLGLRVTIDDKVEDFGLTQDYFESLLVDADEMFGDDEIDIQDPSVNESFTDSRTFQMNPKDTATTRVKLFLSTIKNNKVNALGLSDFVSYDQVFEDLLTLGAGLQSVTYDNLQKALLEKAEMKPYLREVHNKLGILQATNNIQLLNELLTVINKTYTDHTMLLWNKGDDGITVKVISSNRNSVINQIKTDWLELSKISKLITKNKFGNLVINSELAKELYDKFKEVRETNSVTKKKEFLKELFAAMNIPADDSFIKGIDAALKANKFRTFKAKTFSELFGIKNVVENILMTLNEDTGLSTEKSNYEDKNNPIIHERVFNTFANIYYELHSDVYQTGSYQNGESKTIYAYVQPTYLESVRKKLKTKEFLQTLKNRAFSSSSEVINRLLEDDKQDSDDFVYNITYADSIREDDKGEIGKVRGNQSPRELALDVYLKHMNTANRTGYYNMFTLSDKTTSPVVQITKTNFDPTSHFGFLNNKNTIRESFVLKQAFKDKLYDLAKGEIDRMVAYANYPTKEKLRIANFDVASKIFFYFPALNNRVDARLNAIRTKIYQGIEPGEDDASYIKEILAESFKDNILTEVSELLRKGIVVKGTTLTSNTGAVNNSFSFPFFDKAYMGKLSGLNSQQQLIYAIADTKFHYQRAQINTAQILGADHSLFYKESKQVSKEVIEEAFGAPLSVNQLLSWNVSAEATPEEQSRRNIINDVINNTIISTNDEFSKRAAMFIAPGSQGTFMWQGTDGRLVDINNYNVITLKDVIKSNEFFKAIESTDAQEFVTVQEHIDRLMSQGRIPLEVYESIKNKIEEGAKNGTYSYTLTDVELGFALQPTKPVHTSNSDMDGFNEINYVKSSAYPLIPDSTQGSEMNKLRMYMEKNNIASAAFKTATKVGSPVQLLEVFDKDGNFIEPTESDLEDNMQVLSREGLRNQQEIPHQKEAINVVSQMDRQLFEGTEHIKDFDMRGQKMSYKDLKALKEQVRSVMFEHNADELLDRLGVAFKGDYLVFKNERSLASLLKEEAIARNLSVNDVKSIATNKDGKLVIPVYLLANSAKFEGLLTSLFSKVVKLKVTGTSLVQVSGIGTKMSESDLSKKISNEIIYTEHFDPSKGLQYLSKDSKGKVKAAQVFVSQYIKDENGKLVNLKEFVKVGEDGRMVLDPLLLSSKLLDLIGARIPNQLHSSMIPIQVAGFLPGYMENTIIVPDGITAQMGSDFDVDKLYAYLSNPTYTYSMEADEAIAKYNKEIESIKESYNLKFAEIDERLKSLLSSENQIAIKQINESIDKYVARLGYKNLGSKEREQKQRILDGLYDKRSAIYEEVANGVEKKKIQQEKYKLKIQRKAEIQEVQDKIKEQKSKINSIETVDYMYNDDMSIKKIKSLDLNTLSEDQLLELYKDIHWAVLTHKDVFDKITTSIDLSDYNDEKALFYKEGIVQTPRNFMPFDYTTQLGIYLDNRSGKLGTGIFAQLLSFLSEHQDKNVGFTAGVEIKTDTGEIVELKSLTKAGSTTFTNAKGETVTRTKTQNASVSLSESVDNAKNKNLNVFNLNSLSMSPAKLLMSLTSSNGRVADIRYVTRFFPQFAIKYLNQQEEIGKDSFEESKKFGQDVMTDTLSTFFSMISEQTRTKLELQSAGDIKTVPMNPQELLDLLKKEVKLKSKLNQILLLKDVNLIKFTPADRAEIDEFILAQISILKQYYKLQSYSTPQSTLMNNSNVISQGIGSDLFSFLNKYQKLQKIAMAADEANGEGLPVVMSDFNGNVGITDTLNNIGDIYGKFTMLDDSRFEFIPTTQTGHATKNSVLLAHQILSRVAPVHFSTEFMNILSEIILQKNRGSIGIDSYGKVKYSKIANDIMSNLKAFIFSNEESGFVGDFTAERQRLLIGTGAQPSLAERVLKAGIDFPELKSNYFFARLTPVIPTVRPSVSSKYLKYKSPFSQDIDELSNNKAFLDLMMNPNEEISSIAKDLIKYAFVTGGVASKTSFFRFIPTEVLLYNKKYTDFAGKFHEKFILNAEKFYDQYIMNNPSMATYINSKLHQAFTNAVKTTKTTSGETIYTLPETKDLLISGSIIDITMGIKDPNPSYPRFLRAYESGGKIMLYKRVGERSYVRIGTLGSDNVYEYNLNANNYKELKSVDFNNLTPAQKVGELVKVSLNPFNGFTGNANAVINEIDLANYATTAVSFVFNSEKLTSRDKIFASVYKDNINKDEFDKDDTVLVSGTKFLELLSGDVKYDYAAKVATEQVVTPFFNEAYKPILDKIVKAGASVVINAKSEGIATMTQNYLKSKGYEATKIGTFDNIKLSLKEGVIGEQTTSMEEGPVTEPNFDEEAPATDEGVAVVPISMLFGKSLPEDPKVVVTPEVSAEPVLLSDNDVIKNYIPNPDKPNTLSEVLKSLRANTKSQFNTTLLDLLQKTGELSGVTVVVTDTISDPAAYNTASKQILIHPNLVLDDNPALSREDNLEAAIVHELMHAYTAQSLFKVGSKGATFKFKEERTYAVAIKKLYEQTRDKILASEEHGAKLKAVLAKTSDPYGEVALDVEEKEMYYGLTSEHEFVSMLMTDKTFQKFMSETTIGSNNKNIVSLFAEILNRLLQALSVSLGFDVETSSVLHQGVANITNLLSVIDTSEQGPKVNDQLPLFTARTSNLGDYSINNQCK